MYTHTSCWIPVNTQNCHQRLDNYFIGCRSVRYIMGQILQLKLTQLLRTTISPVSMLCVQKQLRSSAYLLPGKRACTVCTTISPVSMLRVQRQLRSSAYLLPGKRACTVYVHVHSRTWQNSKISQKDILNLDSIHCACQGQVHEITAEIVYVGRMWTAALIIIIETTIYISVFFYFYFAAYVRCMSSYLFIRL